MDQRPPFRWWIVTPPAVLLGLAILLRLMAESAETGTIPPLPPVPKFVEPVRCPCCGRPL